MSIEAKLARFVARQALDCIEVDVAAAWTQHAIRLHKSCLATTCCEDNAACASVRLGKGVRAFIGRHSYMNDGGYLRGPVFIGRYCSIGRRVSIGAAMHAMDGLSTAPVLEGAPGDDYSVAEAERLFGKARPRRGRLTVLENDVWVGDGAVLLPGVRVGTGAVIAANSVVTRDVAPYEVVGGVNAKTVRHRFPPDVVDALLASRWWDLDPDGLKALPLGHVLRFLERIEADRPASPAVANYKVMPVAVATGP